MKQFFIHDANRNFSKLLAEVAGYQEFVITKRGVSVARLVAVSRITSGQRLEVAIERMVAVI